MAIKFLPTEKDLKALRNLDSCVVSNAIETFHTRLRNTGFTDSTVHCIFPDMDIPMVGYAATARLRSGDPPIVGGSFHDRTSFWNSILEIPAPRVLVLEDLDDPPGRGAFVGDMHAAILKALGCIGYLTNGAVRDLLDVRNMSFQLFAGNAAVSHAYAHIFDLGATVRIGGMEVHHGDLLHGDRHGVLTIPMELATKIPAAASRSQQSEKVVIDFCQSNAFSVTKLREIMKAIR
jgi:4-hydroxy-4-methyl-2-oxoglutarate aldolase